MSLYSIGHAGTTASGQQTTPSGNATLEDQGRHRTSGGIRLHPQKKTDATTEDATTDGVKTGTATIASATRLGGNAFHLHHPWTDIGTRMPLTSCSSANATTSEAGKRDTGR